MNRKLFFISLLVCAMIASSFLLLESTPQTTADNKTQQEDAENSTTSVERPTAIISSKVNTSSTGLPIALSDNEFKAYSVIIRSKLRGEGAALADFTNTLNIALSLKGKGPFKGVIYEVKFESEDPDTDIPPHLGFTFDYRSGEFSHVSMLGLPSQHPLNIVPTLLAQFSYFEGTRSIELADGIHTYVYTLKGDQVTRLKAENARSSASYETLAEHDIWNLTLDTSLFPSRLQTSAGKTFVMDGSELQLEQDIAITPIEADASILANVSFDVGTNAQYRVAFNETGPKIDVNDENFMETLVAFDASPDLSTAQALGVYLVNQGWGFVRDLLNEDDITDSMRSSLIFALERSGAQEGEYMLAALIEDDSLGETDRLRAIMSIVKMGETNSQVALSALQNMLDHPNELLAQTAILNIGILGNQNPQMSSDVTSFLSERLSSEGSGYSELLAISNLGNSALDSQVLPYLNSEYADERQVAVKLLSRNPDMQPTLLNQMLSDSHPNVVKAITTGIENHSQDFQLNESDQARIRSRLDAPDILAPTRDLLFMFLANNAQPTALNKSAARKMLDAPGVSESTLVLAQELLNQ
ncbi:HEAT repeat domain-containing protein [Enterovibrio norvegicus]|uniref:HEAT repeat domain-containing protein n=1 Tax=Enterovibrio norvegicus TaxID=188144 RepID=UPI0013D2E71B|nr:HEAT repeat domain-containing protein [Enterovibrio norvegicus]